MSSQIVDYVVRSGNGIWTVWRRSYDPALAWLQTHEMSRHVFPEDAVIEMRELNLANALAGLCQDSLIKTDLPTIAVRAT